MSLTSSENQSEYLSNNNNQNYKNNSHNPIFIISVGPTGCGKSKTRDLVIKNFNLDIEVKDILEFSIDNVIEADKDYRIFLNLIFELYNNDTLIKKLVKNPLELKKWNHFFKFFKNYKSFLNIDGRMDTKNYKKFNNYKLMENPILKMFISDCNFVYFGIRGNRNENPTDKNNSE